MFAVGGAAVAGCWISAVVGSVPPRAAVAWQQRGETELQLGHLTNAERLFQRVLERAPESTSARRGLACALWATGRRGAAAIEIALAMQDGMPLSSMTCGRIGSLASHFDRAVGPVPIVFVIPAMRRRPRVVAEALRVIAQRPQPFRTGPYEGRRMMAAACLTWREGYHELAFQYARLGGRWEAGGAELRTFLSCLEGRADDISCSAQAERLPQCGIRGDLLRTMHADREYGSI